MNKYHEHTFDEEIRNKLHQGQITGVILRLYRMKIQTPENYDSL